MAAKITAGQKSGKAYRILVVQLPAGQATPTKLAPMQLNTQTYW